jgi:hypothetical protein
MEVEWGTGVPDYYPKQTIYAYTGGSVYTRTFDDHLKKWSGWVANVRQFDGERLYTFYEHYDNTIVDSTEYEDFEIVGIVMREGARFIKLGIGVSSSVGSFWNNYISKPVLLVNKFLDNGSTGWVSIS